MSLLQNFNKRSLTIAATVLAVLVGGVGVSFALSALPDLSNDNAATTTIAGVTTSVLANVDDSTVSVVVPGSTATSSTMTGLGATIPETTSSTSIGATPMTTTVGAPPAASIGGGVGGDDDDDDEGDEDDDDDDHDEDEGDDDGDDD